MDHCPTKCVYRGAGYGGSGQVVEDEGGVNIVGGGQGLEEVGSVKRRRQRVAEEGKVYRRRAGCRGGGQGVEDECRVWKWRDGVEEEGR